MTPQDKEIQELRREVERLKKELADAETCIEELRDDFVDHFGRGYADNYAPYCAVATGSKCNENGSCHYRNCIGFSPKAWQKWRDEHENR